MEVDVSWFCVRTVFRFNRDATATYEERLTLWQAGGFSAAVALAETEANDYAASLQACAYTGLAQAYRLFEAPRHGAEVFSQMRDSDLTTEAYLTAFFNTGQRTTGQRHR